MPRIFGSKSFFNNRSRKLTRNLSIDLGGKNHEIYLSDAEEKCECQQSFVIKKKLVLVARKHHKFRKRFARVGRFKMQHSSKNCEIFLTRTWPHDFFWGEISKFCVQIPPTRPEFQALIYISLNSLFKKEKITEK